LLGNIYLIILYHIFSDMFRFCLSHDQGATFQGITQYIREHTELLKSATHVTLEAQDIVVLDTDWPVQL